MISRTASSVHIYSLIVQSYSGLLRSQSKFNGVYSQEWMDRISALQPNSIPHHCTSALTMVGCQLDNQQEVSKNTFCFLLGSLFSCLWVASDLWQPFCLCMSKERKGAEWPEKEGMKSWSYDITSGASDSHSNKSGSWRWKIENHCSREQVKAGSYEPMERLNRSFQNCMYHNYLQHTGIPW